MNKLLDIVHALDVIAFEPLPLGRFEALSLTPTWFEKLYQTCIEQPLDENDKEFDLVSAFPFVENFMFDAEKIWASDNDGTVNSGLWIEDSDAGEVMMEAFALKTNDHCYLLIKNMADSYEKRQHVFQKAREIALANEKMVVELNHRQRSLQSQIESHLKHEASLSAISQSVDSTSSAVMVCQPDGSVEVFNKALIDIYQIEEDKEFSRRSLLDHWIQEAEQYYPEIQRVVSSGKHWEGEFESKDLMGKRKWIRLAIGPVKNEHQKITHFVCVANDLSKFMNVGLSDSGNVNEYDFTTHLPNRRYFWKKINACLEQGDACTLVYIDLDYFKSVNDRIGHDAGDQVLGAMASRISRGVKRTDFVAHLGGDEFLVILVGDKVSKNAAAICDRLLGSIREPLTLAEGIISVSASIGFAEHVNGQSAADLLKHADTAMYAAKELGRNHARSYSQDLDKKLDVFHQREYEIRSAIESQQFELYYQPQISIKGEPYFRLEALARWNHPELGLVAPIDFIPVAESSGLIVSLGEWILATACKQGNILLCDNIPIKVAVNISAKQLKHPDFYKLLTDVLENTGFPADRLELEITESCFLDDMDKVTVLLNKIKDLGVAISLDDFGTGFSSLNYLRRLPVDFLKIDQSFVQELPDDRESQVIISSIISLAHLLEKKVIAEGVETEEQLALLNQYQCDFIQGYMFYKPLPFGELTNAYQNFKKNNLLYR
ncbi:EAL domain-containing protein [Reinekea marina]|uniref:EAL domain-containing protein n=1 Tax=Reinekea marina TaxID=1310421 RepID=A0ABV7WPK4_9GAMM|nr:EAL domain-containing protein [Reinekea marina]MDN3649857.1 EAL domain-containing protein [Reinekea marina]